MEFSPFHGASPRQRMGDLMERGHAQAGQIQPDQIQFELAIRQLQKALLAKAFAWVRGCLWAPYAHRQDLTSPLSRFQRRPKQRLLAP